MVGVLQRSVKRWLALALFWSCQASTCEAQDFVYVDEPLRVSALKGRYAAFLSEGVSQDLVLRYAVDYRVVNLASGQVEVVVFAESAINDVPRASGQAVLRLQGGEEMSGRISDLSLEYGNHLSLALQCCSMSRCRPSEVLCPSVDPEGEPEGDPIQAGYLCMEGCSQDLWCVSGCPAEVLCEEACAEAADAERCVAEQCGRDSLLASCAVHCAGDERCLESCLPSAGCVQACEAEGTACFVNCQALYRRCTGSALGSLGNELPCSLCGGSGRCTLQSRGDDLLVVDGSGAELSCTPRCVGYPAACSRGCATSYGEDGLAQLSCMQNCVWLQQQWCSYERQAIDPNMRVPCCFSEHCEAEMESVVKLAAVECFSDVVCGSARRCNRRGLCENRLRDEQSGCQTLKGAPFGVGALLLGLLFLAWWGRRRKGITWLLSLILVTGVLLGSGTAQAEPPGFRRTRSALVLGLSLFEHFGSEMGSVSRLGMGVWAQETLQSGYLGLTVRLGGGVSLTKDEGLPFDSGYQLFSFSFGPRLLLPLLDTEMLCLYIQPELSYVGIQSNTVVRATGGSQYLGGVGGSLGLQWIPGGVVLEVAAHSTWLWEPNTASVMLLLGVGLSGLL